MLSPVGKVRPTKKKLAHTTEKKTHTIHDARCGGDHEHSTLSWPQAACSGLFSGTQTARRRIVWGPTTDCRPFRKSPFVATSTQKKNVNDPVYPEKSLSLYRKCVPDSSWLAVLPACTSKCEHFQFGFWAVWTSVDAVSKVVRGSRLAPVTISGALVERRLIGLSRRNGFHAMCSKCMELQSIHLKENGNRF